ncbi:MAG TPA: hypothetical protein VHT70_05655 [Candidatus Saccharimonadales bacterium]|jgi:hypothetical protein|nr:hypothetical protein [Candidatus Saccharimonadales bacterium]
MDMQTINKEVQVNAFYFVRHTKNFKMFPKEVEVDGERRTFHESGLQYLIRKGQQLVELFDMSDGRNTYRLRCENGHWTLVSQRSLGVA